MEGGGSSAGSGRGGGDLCTAAQEPREDDGAAARSGGGAPMRARVCASVRTPQGIGALLLVGGAIVGAAVVAWRRRHGAKKRHREQPDKEEVLDGGVVEDEQGKFDQSDENLSTEDTGVGANGLDGKATEELHQIPNGKATQELHEIQEDEIVTDESVPYFCAIFSECGFQDGEPVEKFDQNSSRKTAEMITDDTESGNVKKSDENSSNSNIESEISPNATEGVENSDQSTTSLSSPEIAHEDHDEHNDGAQGATSTLTILTTQMMTHQPQILEELKTDTATETAEAELTEGTTMEENVFEQEEKSLVELVEPVTSPANSSLPSLLKPTEKKRLVNRGWKETGMKLEQDYTNDELSKGFATQGLAVVTMDRRAASMAILALIFAVTIGVNIVVRLYSFLQAT